MPCPRDFYLILKKGEAIYDQQWKILLKIEQFRLSNVSKATRVDSPFIDQVCTTSAMDPLVFLYQMSL